MIGSSPTIPSRTPVDVSTTMVANRQEQMSEEAAINPYYNNFFSTYRIGPEDVISVDVFNQERYSRRGITFPPSGRISLSSDSRRRVRQWQDGRRSRGDHQAEV